MNQQMITAYEEEAMTVEEIAEQFEMEELSVKALLMQFSPRYREHIKESKNVENEFTNTDEREALDVVRSIMQQSDDDNLRLRAAKYIRDDKKGRLDALSGLKSLNINIALFNQRLLEARAAKERSKEIKSIPIESEVVETK